MVFVVMCVGGVFVVEVLEVWICCEVYVDVVDGVFVLVQYDVVQFGFGLQCQCVDFEVVVVGCFDVVDSGWCEVGCFCFELKFCLWQVLKFEVFIFVCCCGEVFVDGGFDYVECYQGIGNWLFLEVGDVIEVGFVGLQFDLKRFVLWCDFDLGFGKVGSFDFQFCWFF